MDDVAAAFAATGAPELTGKIRICIFSSTSPGFVATAYDERVWMVPATDVGGLRIRASRLRPRTPCIFYVSRAGNGMGYFWGPGLTLDRPSDDIARQESRLFPGRDWCLGFHFEPLALSLRHRMDAERIRSLAAVGGGNYSQVLHLAGRCVFLPVELSVEDCRVILDSTGAKPGSLGLWHHHGRCEVQWP
jgi:hypothetical protein